MNGVLHEGLCREMGAVWVAGWCCDCRDFIGCLWASAVTGLGLGGSGGGGIFYKVDLRFRE